MPLKIYSLLLLMFSASVLAESKHVLVMGGGGEPSGATTIFDRELGNFKEFIKKDSHWKVSAAYNGGHYITEEILHDGLVQGAITPFTEKTYNEMLDDYESRILKGEIKKGDQLLVYISSHGAKKKEGDKTHQIAVSGTALTNLTTLEGADIVSLDRLQNLIDLSKKHGIKLGVLDFSCFSGNTLALTNPDTCIISSAPPDNFAYAGADTFNVHFTKSMASGKSLEEVFLQTFGDRKDISFPMISTDVGKELHDELYKLISPYYSVWEKREEANKFKHQLENQVIENKCEEAEKNFNKILAFSVQAEEITKRFSFFKGNNEFREFEEAVKKYYDLQKSMREDLTKLKLAFVKAKGNEQEEFCPTVNTTFRTADKTFHFLCQKRTINELISTDYAKVRQYKIDRLNNEDDPLYLARARAQLEMLEKEEERKKQLLKIHPELESYNSYYKNLPHLYDETYKLALEISLKGQVIYKKLYKEKSKNRKEKNACKDFVL